MATSGKKPVKVRSFNPQGEGDGVPVALAPAEPGRTSFQLHLSEVAAPEKVFTADSYCVIEAVQGFRLVFWMSKAFGHGARSLVELVVAKSALESFEELLGGLAPSDAVVTEPSVLVEEPSSAIALTATFARFSSNDMGAVMDFYYASPFSMQAAGRSATMHLQGVVRIHLPNGIFFGLAAQIGRKKESNDSL